MAFHEPLRKGFNVATTNMAVPVSTGSVSPSHTHSRITAQIVVGGRWYLVLMITIKVILTSLKLLRKKKLVKNPWAVQC